MIRHARVIVASAIAVLVMACSAAGQPASEPYKEVLGYRFDQPRAALAAIEAEIRSASPQQIRAIEARLLATLQSPAATRDCKDWVCRQLRQAGSAESVDALAPLLADKELATVARLALQSIPGPKVDAALRNALAGLEGDLKIGVILSIGARRDPQAVPLLLPLIGNPQLADAALHALGQIGSAEALRGLQGAKVPKRSAAAALHARLLCAERMAAEGQAAEAAKVYADVYGMAQDRSLKAAALRGMAIADKASAVPVLLTALRGQDRSLRLAAARVACELGGTEILGPILANLALLPGEVQVSILGLVDDKSALPAVLKAAKSEDPAVRVAALGALGRLGDASCVTLLLGVSATDPGEAREAARRSLRLLRGNQVDELLVGAARRGEPGARREAIGALAARGAASAVPILLETAADAASGVSAEALVALAVLAEARHLPAMVKLLVEAKAEGVRGDVERALIAACQRIEDKEAAASAVIAALPGPSAGVRCSLVRVLARTPGAKSLSALRAAAGDAEPSVKDAAIRGLAEWPDPAAIDDLAAIARSAASQAHKVLALRGLVRLVALPSDRPAPESVKLLAEALALSGRAEEKKLVLAALAELNHPKALEVAVSCLADKELEVEAATAVVKIARSVQRTDAEAAAAAVRKVLEVCKSPAARQVAEGAMVVLGGMVNIAPQGIASSPDGLEKDGAAGGDQAAIDGDPATYWDEEDDQKLYRLVVTFKQPERIAALSIMGYEHHNYAPKDFEVLCDGNVVKRIVNAQYDNNLLVIRLEEMTVTTVELRITGYYGRSPAIRELGIYRPGRGKQKALQQ
jgi:HEAT repeat protein